MNILVTINTHYIPYLMSMLKSLLYFNKTIINLYIISKDVTKEILTKYYDIVNKINIEIIDFDDNLLFLAPTSKRYPKTVYYRLFAFKVLPSNIDRILYLDSDIIINGSLKQFYNMDMTNIALIGSTTIKEPLRKFNEIKNNALKGSPYINTGVLLMNLDYLRNNTNEEEIYDYITKKHKFFTLPDQDIVSALYGDKTILVPNEIYNLSDRGLKFYNFYHIEKIDLNWIKENTLIIHYYGKNKPWHKNYKGILKCFYDKFKVE